MTAPVVAHADDASSTDLDKVVVTASRTEQTLNQVLSASTVIDRADIERLQPRSLADLLRTTPGVSIANNGGPGKATSVFMRGTESDHVLVLVDGVKIGSATSGTAAFQDIPVDQIERIEIVRGPYSSLYGSDALGGVIQIFTRHPQGAFVPNLSVGVGSWSTLRGSAGFAGRGANGWYSVEASHDQTHGINACRGKPSPGGGGCYTYEPDDDGYRNNALSLKGGWRFDEQWDADASATRSEGHNYYDGTSSNYAESATQTVGGRLRYRPAQDALVTLNVGRSLDLSTDYENGVYADTFNTHRDLASLQADLGKVGGAWGLTTLGFDWQRDRVVGSTDYFVDARRNHALFAQWQQEFGDNSIQGSVRRDENSQFGGKTTGSLQYGYALTKDLRVTASYGTAFRAPNLGELYSPGYGGYYAGNPALDPERSRTVELGLEWRIDGANRFGARAFATRVHDLVDFSGGDTFQAINIERAAIDGVELTHAWHGDAWSIDSNATLQNPRNSNSGTQLLRRPKKKLDSVIERGFGERFRAGVEVVANGKRDDVNAVTLPGYALLNLRASFLLSRNWRLGARLENAFDRFYELAHGYNTPGRSGYLDLVWQPSG